uniref:Uncharacterized protein n=1 Tax=Oryza nivara TaxID=4536 RepID=A0A0E0J1H4_ORYNI
MAKSTEATAQRPQAQQHQNNIPQAQWSQQIPYVRAYCCSSPFICRMATRRWTKHPTVASLRRPQPLAADSQVRRRCTCGTTAWPSRTGMTANDWRQGRSNAASKLCTVVVAVERRKLLHGSQQRDWREGGNSVEEVPGEGVVGHELDDEKPLVAVAAVANEVGHPPVPQLTVF